MALMRLKAADRSAHRAQAQETSTPGVRRSCTRLAGGRRDEAPARVDRVGMTLLPSARSHFVPGLQSFNERSADAFKAAIAKAKLFEMCECLEEILR